MRDHYDYPLSLATGASGNSYTYLQYTAHCAEDALLLGARGFSLRGSDGECWIHLLKNPNTKSLCCATKGCGSRYSATCPQKSIFGETIYSGADWQLNTHGGFGEILGLDSSQARSSRCFVNNNLPTATPTDFPTTPAPTALLTELPTDAWTVAPTAMPLAMWSFRYIGDGLCTTAAGRPASHNRMHYDYPYTNKTGEHGVGYTSAEVREHCAQDALAANAIGFTVIDNSSFYRGQCLLHTPTAPSCPSGIICTSADPTSAFYNADCLPRSVYGVSRRGGGRDWSYSVMDGHGPITGVHSLPGYGYSCYAL